MTPGDTETLKRTALARAMSTQTLERLARESFAQILPTGAVLFEQGGEPQFVYVLVAGRVALEAHDGHRRSSTVVEVFGQGETILVPAVVLKKPYLVTARVTDDARVVLVPAESFRRALAHDHRLSLAVSEMLARHWRILVRQIKDLKLRTASQRFGSYLLGQLDQQAAAESFRLPEPRQVIAARLGMTPESLSRAVAELRKYGVQVRGRAVQIASLERLRSYCSYDDLS